MESYKYTTVGRWVCMYIVYTGPITQPSKNEGQDTNFHPSPYLYVQGRYSMFVYVLKNPNIWNIGSVRPHPGNPTLNRAHRDSVKRAGFNRNPRYPVYLFIFIYLFVITCTDNEFKNICCGSVETAPNHGNISPYKYSGTNYNHRNETTFEEHACPCCSVEPNCQISYKYFK